MAYTNKQKQKILEGLIDQMIDGKSLRQICREDKKLPHRITLLRWMNEDEEFATNIARARDIQAEAKFDQIDDILTKMESGELDHQVGKTIIWAIQWQASKLKPKKYGDRVNLDHGAQSSFSDMMAEIYNKSDK